MLLNIFRREIKPLELEMSRSSESSSIFILEFHNFGQNHSKMVFLDQKWLKMRKLLNKNPILKFLS